MEHLKDYRELRIVFMGTPSFAAYSLEFFLKAGLQVVGVVTTEDKPAGRGLQVKTSAVKEVALKHQLPLLQPPKLKDAEFLDRLSSWQADVFIVVAFRMLPELVWSMPPLGTINLHASLLPQYRGAAPINHAIIQGETETGVTTFFIEKEIDTGKILLQEKIQIEPTETAGSLHDKLMVLGADLLLKTLQELTANKSLVPMEQENNQQLKSAPKIDKAFCSIDWNQDIHRVYNFVRGLSPYPAAYGFIKRDDKSLSMKIFRANRIEKKHENAPGTILVQEGKSIWVATQNGFLILEEIQLAGKKRMLTKDFLIGFKDLESYSFSLTD